MSKFAALGAGPVLIGGCAIAVAGAVWLVAAQDRGEDIAAPTVAQDAVAEALVAQDEVPQALVVEEAVTQAAPAPVPAAPSVDTFRLEPDGRLILAGQAEPGWQTDVLIDGEVLDRVSPDSAGKFAAFLTLSPSDAPRILTLVSREVEGGAALASVDEIIIAPLAPAEVAKQAETGAQEPAPQVVLRATQEGVDVLQPVALSSAAPEVMSSVALDAITYSETGDVQLAGRGQGAGFVRVYLDNAPLITSQIAADGRWRTDLPEVDTGVYTLRIDEVDAGGAVTSRVETPFKREEEAVVRASQSGTGQTRVDVVTVQPGSTLWAISRETYGDGVMYVRVFEANKDRIRNPDLIYPGQVFSLPQ